MLARWMVRRVSRPQEGRLGGVAPWAVLLALAAVAASVAVGSPRPSLTGVGLGVSLATLVVLGAGLYLVTSPEVHGAVPALAVALLALASAALAGLAPDSPGYLGAFIAVGAMALRFEQRAAMRACVVTWRREPGQRRALISQAAAPRRTPSGP